MHGQKRSEYKSRLLHPETSSKLATKAQQWNHLSRELLTQRRRLFDPPPPVGTADADGIVAAAPSPSILLSLTEKMLSVNPDPSHLWNVRREMLLYVPTASDNSSSSVTTKSSSFDIQAELALTAHCMQRNPKSYSAWYHRKWSLVYFVTNPTTISDDDTSSSSPEMTSDAQSQHLKSMKTILQSELDLCAQFLQLDERNFHCWNYRRFVIALLGSCGGDSPSTGTSALLEKSDTVDQLFNGSWSSWLNRSMVSMGAQLSQSATTAVGNIPHQKSDKGACSNSVAQSIVPLTKQELEEIITNEWDFTTSKIQDNFSNGSAFHYRSKLLPLILESRLTSFGSDEGDEGDGSSNPSPSERFDAILSLAREEWESILLNAIFTEPDDQTPWWYHRFIVSWAKPSDDSYEEAMEEYEALLYEMADSLRDLLEVEKENGMMGNNAENKDESKGAKCKWAHIGLHLVLSTLLESKTMEEEEAVDLREEAAECLAALIKIDPNRKERYQNMVL